MKQQWLDIKKNHPNMWAVLGEREMDGADIIAAELIDICTDNELVKKKSEYIKNGKKYWYVRTTTKPVPSFIHVENALFGVKL